MTKKNSAAIKVAIADDHAIVREGLKQICNSTRDIVVVGSAENGLEAIKLCRLDNCDVLLLDIVLPDRSGI
ncbi:MAG TPA: response regulator transcription factor, partial [Herbaspirillum sp.]|nr:response regulator transcription factor [Herbaspirillum sp.]